MSEREPWIERPHAKLAAIERRLDYLDECIGNGQGGPAMNFDRAERSALRVAAELYRDYIDGGGWASLVALAELVEARADMTLHTTRASEAFDRAREVLGGWSDTP